MKSSQRCVAGLYSEFCACLGAAKRFYWNIAKKPPGDCCDFRPGRNSVMSSIPIYYGEHQDKCPECVNGSGVQWLLISEPVHVTQSDIDAYEHVPIFPARYTQRINGRIIVFGSSSAE